MADIDKKASGLQLLLVGQLGHAENRGETDPSILADPKQLFDLPALDPVGQVGPQHILVFAAIGQPLKNLPLSPLGIAHQIDQPLPLVFFSDNQEHQTVLARKDIPGVQRPLTQTGGNLLLIGVVRGADVNKRSDIGLSGKVDVFAQPGLQGHVIGRQGSGRRCGGDLEIGLMAGGLERRQLGPVRTARTQPRPAPTVGNGQLIGGVVLVRAAEAEGRDGAHDQARVARLKGGVVETQAGHACWSIVVDHDIRLRDQLHQPLALAGQVEDNAVFVGVEIQEQAALFGVGHAVRKRAALPDHVPAGLFDLDDLGAEIGHQLGSIGRRHHVSQLNDLHPVQSLHSRSPLTDCRRLVSAGAASPPTLALRPIALQEKSVGQKPFSSRRPDPVFGLLCQTPHRKEGQPC